MSESFRSRFRPFPDVIHGDQFDPRIRADVYDLQVFFQLAVYVVLFGRPAFCHYYEHRIHTYYVIDNANVCGKHFSNSVLYKSTFITV